MSNYTTDNLVTTTATNNARAIKIGDQIFTGFSEGGSATKFYKCGSVNSSDSTWTGKEAILSEGGYTFASESTSGLTYSTITPVVGRCYNDECTINSLLGQTYIPLIPFTGYSTSSSHSYDQGQILHMTRQDGAAQTGYKKINEGSCYAFHYRGLLNHTGATQGTIYNFPMLVSTDQQAVTYKRTDYWGGVPGDIVQDTAYGTTWYYSYGLWWQEPNYKPDYIGLHVIDIESLTTALTTTQIFYKALSFILGHNIVID